ESGKEIVFAEELGSWMIRADEKTLIRSYLSSLASVATPDAFTVAAIPLIKRDSFQSFSCKVYSITTRAANKEQLASLKVEVERQNVRTAPKRRRYLEIDARETHPAELAQSNKVASADQHQSYIL